ncbi:hypothetical protein GIB67_042845 [Kingdonia uniflora]|uniref:Uncharacterized protein n=1 Tax=Kingdonia uniflora TaxID=39325 RepID=A0A7J7NSL8_9MAGN|nr:hypothetical protein GIB67_042845 [Kingdonia uniflora]
MKVENKANIRGKEAPGLVEAQVYNRDEVWEQLIGSQKGTVGSTNANELSSRNDDRRGRQQNGRSIKIFGGKYKDDQDVRSASDIVFRSERLLHVSKLKCRVVGAYIEKTGSKAFSVYSIACLAASLAALIVPGELDSKKNVIVFKLEALPAIRGTDQLGSNFRVFPIYFLNKDKRLR